jgi:hypothetical protein
LPPSIVSDWQTCGIALLVLPSRVVQNVLLYNARSARERVAFACDGNDPDQGKGALTRRLSRTPRSTTTNNMYWTHPELVYEKAGRVRMRDYPRKRRTHVQCLE